MKIVRFSVAEETGYGVMKNNLIEEIQSPFCSEWENGPLFTGNTYSLNQVLLLPPSLPSKMLCLGLNYRTHAREVNLPIPKHPLLFMKPSTAVIGPEENIIHPPHN